LTYAQMLIIGGGKSKAEEAEKTARWHQEERIWLCNSEADLPIGTPVVARMAGPSNELLLDGIVAGTWLPSRYTEWDWRFEIPVAWSRHIIWGVRAGDILPGKGLTRPSHIELTHPEWAAVQEARLSQPEPTIG
jgi:hypothetical protein